MRNLKQGFLLSVAVAALACSEPRATSPELVAVQDAAMLSGANSPLSATVEFGQPDVGSPFPASAQHDESAHAKDNIVPRTVVIDRGGTVTFNVPAGVHQIAIYAPGKDPQDVNTAVLIALCPGTIPRIINDSNGRLALITHACNSAWQAQYTFTTPGRHLVICPFLPHFEVGMYGWVEVR
jgi:plastocyanin